MDCSPSLDGGTNGPALFVTFAVKWCKWKWGACAVSVARGRGSCCRHRAGHGCSCQQCYGTRWSDAHQRSWWCLSFADRAANHVGAGPGATGPLGCRNYHARHLRPSRPLRPCHVDVLGAFAWTAGLSEDRAPRCCCGHGLDVAVCGATDFERHPDLPEQVQGAATHVRCFQTVGPASTAGGTECTHLEPADQHGRCARGRRHLSVAARPVRHSHRSDRRGDAQRSAPGAEHCRRVSG